MVYEPCLISVCLSCDDCIYNIYSTTRFADSRETWKLYICASLVFDLFIIPLGKSLLAYKINFQKNKFKESSINNPQE